MRKIPSCVTGRRRLKKGDDRRNETLRCWTSGRVQHVILTLMFVASISGILSTTMEITMNTPAEKATLDVTLDNTVIKSRETDSRSNSRIVVPPVKPSSTQKKPDFSPRTYSALPLRYHSWNKNASSPIIDIDDPILNPYISWDNSPVVLEDFRLLFFTTPKVGSTVFKQLFRRMMKIEGWSIDDGFDIPHSPRMNGLKYLYDYPTERAEEILTDPKWTRAIFTRDPMKRILSAYLDKGARENGAYVKNHCCGIKTRTRPKKQVVVANTLQDPRPGNVRQYERKQLLGIPMGANPPVACSKLNSTTPVSWEMFVLDLLPNCTEEEHWKSQVSPALRWINFVGSFDHLAADTRRMLKQVGAWEDYGATGWHGGAIFENNTIRHKTSSQELFASYYANLTIRHAVQDLYRKDYNHPLLRLSIPQPELSPS